MVATFDVDKSENWQQVYTNSYAADRIPGKQVPIYIPIEPQELPIVVTSRLLAIFCSSDTYPDYEKYLGRAIQTIVNPGNFPTSVSTGNAVSLYANRTVLANFPQFDDDYSLIIKPKFYVEQLTITVFEYVGSDYYEVEQRLNIIEGKIDQLL